MHAGKKDPRQTCYESWPYSHPGKSLAALDVDKAVYTNPHCNTKIKSNN